jgi:nickel superoxide dismutase
MRSLMTLIVVLGIALVAGQPAMGHCQIPCGIYDDLLRVRMMEEHVTTIERSIKGLNDHLGKTEAADANQQVRWVMNKEVHADLITKIVTEYFLQQRIKAPKAGDDEARKVYLERLETLHGMLVTSMKTKQTVDPSHATRLRELIDKFKRQYFSPEDLAHLGDEH